MIRNRSIKRKILAGIAASVLLLNGAVAWAAEGDIIWKQTDSYNPGVFVSKIKEYNGDLYAAGYSETFCIDWMSGDSKWYVERRNGTTGARMWQHVENPTPSQNCLRELLVDGTGVYLAGHDSWDSYGWRVEKFNSTTGALVWSKLIPEGGLGDLGYARMDATGVYITGNYYTGSGNEYARIIKLSKTGGSVLWNQNAAIRNMSSPVSLLVDGTGLYDSVAGSDMAGGFSTHQEKIEKRDLTTGNLIWAQIGPPQVTDVGFALNARLVGLSGSALYGTGAIFSGSNNIDKRDAATGSLIWTHSSNGGLQYADNTGIYTLYNTGGGCFLCLTGDWIVEKHDPSNFALVWAHDLGKLNNPGVGMFAGNNIYRITQTTSDPLSATFNKFDLGTGSLVRSTPTYTLPDTSTEHVLTPWGYTMGAFVNWLPNSDGVSFYTVKNETGATLSTSYSFYKHTLIPISVDCSTDIVLGTQRWASCNATQNPQFWYPGVSATTVDANGWPYGALYNGGTTNACSAGYHMPSWDDWKQALQTLGVSVTLGPLGNPGNPGDYTVLRNALKLPLVGDYNFNGSGAYENKDVSTRYWASDWLGPGVGGLDDGSIEFYTPPNDYFGGTWNGAGLPIRCIADNPQPDLTALTPQVNTGTLVAGQTVTFKADVKNIGGADAPGLFNNRFQIDMDNNGSYGDAVDVNLDANNSGTTLLAGANKTIVSPSWTAVAGTHTIRMCADMPPNPPGNVTESDENNNCSTTGYTFTVAPAPLPDLTASWIGPNTATVGQQVIFTASVSNNNVMDVPTDPIHNIFQFSTDGTAGGAQPPIAGSDINNGLAKNASKPTTYTWTPTSPGTYYVRACADNNTSWVGTVTESDETNNCTNGSGYATITVTSPAPSATLTGSGCAIAANASTCNGSFTWNIQNATNPNLYNTTLNTPYSNNASGMNELHQITNGSNIIQARDNSSVLKWITVTGSCVPSTSWNGSICVSNSGNMSISLSASPTQVVAGDKTQLTWTINSGNPNQCTASGDWSGSKSKTGGTELVAVPNQPSTYTLTCSDGNGNQDSATVRVYIKLDFTITPQ